MQSAAYCIHMQGYAEELLPLDASWTPSMSAGAQGGPGSGLQADPAKALVLSFWLVETSIAVIMNITLVVDSRGR